MDKNLVNNQIILMRKTVKNAKRLVKQKLHKQIQKLESKLKRNPSNISNENKIKHKRSELIAVNGVNVDEVAKQALIQTKKHFEDVIRSSQSTPNERAMARIGSNQLIEKVVNKFKEDNPNCDHWLPSQIELWQKKKEMKRQKIMKKKGSLNEETESAQKASEDEPKDELNTNKNESKPSKAIKANEVKKNEPKIVTKSDVQKKSVPKVDDKIVEKVEEKKPKSDPFFLSNDSNASDDESDEANESDEDEEQRRFGERHSKERDLSESAQKRVRFGKFVGKNNRKPTNTRKPILKGTKTESKPMQKETNSKIAPKQRSKPEEGLHPSWSAKRSAKDKLKIDFNKKPMAKKIKFD